MVDLTPIPGEDVAQATSLTSAARIFATDGGVEYAATRAALRAYLGVTTVDDNIASADVTFLVPTDYATVQAALNVIGSLKILNDVTIEVRIEAGHSITYATSVDGGDYSHVTLTSPSGTVTVGSSFPSTSNVFTFKNCAAPRWSFLLDCNGYGMNGVWLENAKMLVDASCGVQYAGFGKPASVCASQNRTGAGALVIDGTDAAAGAWSNATARRLVVSSGGADTATVTITGTDSGGSALVEAVTLNGRQQICTEGLFKTVTSVASDATIANGFRLGTNETDDPNGCGFFAWKGSSLQSLPTTGPLTGAISRGNVRRGLDITHNSQCSFVAADLTLNGSLIDIAENHAALFASRAGNIQIDNSDTSDSVRGIRAARVLVSARSATYDNTQEAVRVFEAGRVICAGSTFTGCGNADTGVFTIQGADATRPQGGGEIIAESSDIIDAVGDIAVVIGGRGLIDLNDCEVSSAGARLARISGGGVVLGSRIRSTAGGANPMTVSAANAVNELVLVSDGGQFISTGFFATAAASSSVNYIVRCIESGMAHMRGANVAGAQVRNLHVSDFGAYIFAKDVTTDDGESYPDLIAVGGSASGITFPTRAKAVSAIAAGFSGPTGQVFMAGDDAYKFSSGATAISDMAGVVPAGEVYVEHFGAVGDNATDCTASIQAAVDYVGTLGTLYLTKRGQGGFVNFKAGVYRISDQIDIQKGGVVIRGQGPDVTIIRVMDETKDGLVFAGPDPFNTGGADINANVLVNQGVRDLAIRCVDLTDALTTTLIVVRRGLFRASNIAVNGYHTGIALYGVETGTILSDIDMSSNRSLSLTAQPTGDAHIVIGAQQVDPLDPLANGGGDGNFYNRSVGVYLDNIDMSDPQSKYGVTDGVRIECCDGVYGSNIHFGFAARANLAYVATYPSYAIINTFFSGNFFDGDANILGGPTDYMVAFLDPGALGTSILNHHISSSRMNVGATAGVLIDAAGAGSIQIDDFTMNTSTTGGVGSVGLQINRGEDISITNGRIGSCSSGYYIDVGASVGARLHISGIRAADESGTGDATVGMRIAAASAGLVVSDCVFDDCNLTPLSFTTPPTDIKAVKVSNVSGDGQYGVSGIDFGTWTVVISDSSGNNSSTTATGRWYRTGPRTVKCIITQVADISTAGLTAGDTLRVSLPFTQNANARSVGLCRWKDLAAAVATGPDLHVSVGVGTNYAVFQQGNGTAGTDGTMIVSDLSSGVSDLLDFAVDMIIA